MGADGLRIGKLLVFSVAGEAKGIIEIGFDHLELARPTMRVMTVETGDPGLKVGALLVVDPLLVMRFGMGLRISPQTRFQLVVVFQRVS
jgi:hypothetical protein